MFDELDCIFRFVKSFESQGQPVYATLNTVRNQGNENQPIRNGPIRLSIPKSGTTTAKIVTNNRTYQGGNVVSQPIRVQLRQPSSNQNSGQSSNQGGSSGTRTIIQTVQMPRSQQQAQRNRFSSDIFITTFLIGIWKTRIRNSRYATIKQNAIIGTTDNGRRVIQSRNYTPSQNTYSKILIHRLHTHGRPRPRRPGPDQS